MHRTPTLSCPECQAFAATRFGADGWERVGQVLGDDGSPVLHGPTELVSTGMRDEESRDLGVIVEERPNPEAGQPVTFERVYGPRHDSAGYPAPARPRNRPEGQPDGWTLRQLERQVLEWLDHLESTDKYPRQPIEHLQRVDAYGPEWQWLRSVARLSVGFFYASRGPRPKRDRHDAGRRNGRPWSVVRRAAAREILEAVLGEQKKTIRRRLQNHKAKKRPRTE